MGIRAAEIQAAAALLAIAAGRAHGQSAVQCAPEPRRSPAGGSAAQAEARLRQAPAGCLPNHRQSGAR